MKKIFYLTIVVVIMVTACQPKTQPASIDTRADADSIRNLEDQFAIAMQESDIDKIVSFYTSDAVAMCSNLPIAIGLQAIRDLKKICFSDTSYSYKSYSCKINDIQVSASGDLAFARGSDHINHNTPTGTVAEEGKWLDVWKKVDGRWRMVASTWNRDKPLPKP